MKNNVTQTEIINILVKYWPLNSKDCVIVCSYISWIWWYMLYILILCHLPNYFYKLGIHEKHIYPIWCHIKQGRHHAMLACPDRHSRADCTRKQQIPPQVSLQLLLVETLFDHRLLLHSARNTFPLHICIIKYSN